MMEGATMEDGTMDGDRVRGLKLGTRRLPDLKLPSVPTGTPTPLRPPGRVSPVLVLLNDADADADAARASLRSLAEAADEITEWDGRVLVIFLASVDTAATMVGEDATPFAFLADPERTLASRLGLVPPAVLIADQYGEIHHAATGHPDPQEIVGWLRYLAVQCPECQGEAL